MGDVCPARIACAIINTLAQPTKANFESRTTFRQRTLWTRAKMKIDHELGASFIAIFMVLLSGCGKPVDRVRDAIAVDKLDKVREAAIALRIAINDQGTSYNEFRPLIAKFAVEIAVAKEK